MNTLLKKDVSENEVGEILHDLSNAMLAIKGLLLKVQNCDDPITKTEKLIRAIERVKLAEDYLCAKKSHRDIQSVDLAKVLKDTIPFFSGVYSDIELSIEITSNPIVKMDNSLFFNALTNLIKNSIEAEAKRVHIELSECELKICDDGPGITPDILEKIKSEGSSKGDGRGVGLQSIARFCAQTGWEMDFENGHAHSHFEHGLTVTFRW